MFGLFRKNSAKSLQKAYEKKLEQAMHCQRNGDIKGYSQLSAEAEALEKKLKALEADNAR